MSEHIPTGFRPSRDGVHRHLNSLTASGVSATVHAIMVTIWIHGKLSPPNQP